MANFDQYDRLEIACKSHSNYPANLLRSRSFQHSLVAYNERMHKESGDLFDDDPKYAGIKICEAYDGCDFSPLHNYGTLEALRGHFKVERKDPRCRHVFITAPTSRSPLDCPEELFTYTFTFLQVMPRFLDLVFTFGQQDQQKDFYYTTFNEESFVDSHEARSSAIPRLGRSGRDVRLCYNLWSVEESDSPGSLGWAIRQTAVYHSFDIETARSVWINVKGNDLMQRRITQTVQSFRHLRADTTRSYSGAFSAALHTHILIMEWSSENWRSFISSMEKEIRSVLDKAQSIPFRTVEEALTVDPSVLLEQLNAPQTHRGTSQNRTNSGLTNMHFSRVPTAASKLSNFNLTKRIGSGLTGLSTTPTETQVSGSASSPMAPTNRESLPPSTLAMPAKDSQFKVFEQFSFEEKQKLTILEARLQKARLVMSLNMNILGELMEYYETLGSFDSAPQEGRTDCAVALQYFCSRVKGIIQEQKREQSRIDTLMRQLANGKSLFDGILQFLNMELNKLFAVNALQSGQRVEAMTQDMHKSTIEMESMTKSMKQVAEKTEKQTTSMHIITLVTLFFLPGTFVATFFSSGTYQWDQNDAEGSKMPYWKPEYFATFAKICFPMTGGIFFLWLFLYYWANWRGKNAQDDEEKLLESAEEKQL